MVPSNCSIVTSTAQSDGYSNEYLYCVFAYVFHDVVLTVLFVFTFVDAFTFALPFVFPFALAFVVAFVFPLGTVGPLVERQVQVPAAPIEVTPQMGW